MPQPFGMHVQHAVLCNMTRTKARIKVMVFKRFVSVKECKDNTWGDRCQYCKPGFKGDATIGTPYDCLPDGQSKNRLEYLNHDTVLATFCDLFSDTANYYDRYQPYLDATTRSQEVRAECNKFGTAQIVDGNCKCKVFEI